MAMLPSASDARAAVPRDRVGSPRAKGAPEAPALRARASRAAAISVGAAARATSSTMSLGGEIAKRKDPLPFQSPGSWLDKLAAGLLGAAARLLDDFEPLAVAALALILMPCGPVGALYHVRAHRGGGGEARSAERRAGRQ